jgi:hypothetical protein
VRSKLGWFLGGLGFAAAVARLFRRDRAAPTSLPAPIPAPPPRAPEPQPEPEPEPLLEPEAEADPRAEELRRRLDESRTLVDEREEFESGETTIDNAEAPAAPQTSEPAARRRHVHDRGQATIDKMRREPS